MIIAVEARPATKMNQDYDYVSVNDYSHWWYQIIVPYQYAY